MSLLLLLFKEIVKIFFLLLLLLLLTIFCHFLADFLGTLSVEKCDSVFQVPNVIFFFVWFLRKEKRKGRKF